MDTKELKQKSAEELQKMLSDKRAEFYKYRFDRSFSKNKNVKLGSALKKDVARILTVINENKHGGK